MKITTTVRSPGAIALGAACCIGTLVVLFWHVRSPSDFTVNHLYILLALTVAYGSGHFMWDAFGEGWKGVVRGLALTVLFCVGTAICVGLSGGRSAEVFEHNAAQAGHDNGKRLAHEAQIAEANVDRRKAKSASDTAAAKEATATEAQENACADGDGNRCKGAKVTMATAKITAADALKRHEQADARYWQLVAQLGELKPPQEANANLRQLAKLWALYSGNEKRAIEVIMLALPYALALLTEFGSIVFFKHGFNSARETVPVSQFPPVSPETDRKPRGGRMTKAEAERFVVTEAALRGELPSQDWIADRCGVSKGTVSKWLREWERSGLVSRARIGRVKVVEAA